MGSPCKRQQINANRCEPESKHSAAESAKSFDRAVLQRAHHQTVQSSALKKEPKENRIMEELTHHTLIIPDYGKF